MTDFTHPPTTPTPARYHALVASLHWLMLLVIATAFATIQLRELYPKGSDPREWLKAVHFMVGLLVLILLAVRVLARVATPGPAPAGASVWMQRAASAGHLALYVWMLLMPLLGWATLSAAGKPIPFFGLSLPPLLAPDKALAHDLKEIHEALGEAGYWLIGLHAAAAVFHHFVLRDGLLRRMSPRGA